MEGVMQCCWLSTHSQGSKANRSKCPKSWPQFNQNQDPVVLVVLRFPIKIQTRIRIKIGNPSVPRRGSHAMLTHGWGCPTNHPQFRAINCCQLWIGSCRPDLCRILGAFLHFPDNPNCGSLVICGGGEPPPCAMCTIAGTGVTKVGQGKDKGRENTQQQKIWSSPLFVKRLSIPKMDRFWRSSLCYEFSHFSIVQWLIATFPTFTPYNWFGHHHEDTQGLK